MAAEAQTIALSGGFSAPVFDAQAVFRATMEAMARPGSVQALAARAAPPKPLNDVAGMLALTLFDADTAVWLPAALARDDAVTRWLAFQTGTPVTDFAADADFALIADTAAMPSLESFAQGSQEYPDRSTTLILQVASLSGGPGLTLSGPGIRDTAVISPNGLPPHFIEQWRANRARFPRGVDILLAAPEALIALPRSTRIEES